MIWVKSGSRAIEPAEDKAEIHVFLEEFLFGDRGYEGTCVFFGHFLVLFHHLKPN